MKKTKDHGVAEAQRGANDNGETWTVRADGVESCVQGLRIRAKVEPAVDIKDWGAIKVVKGDVIGLKPRRMPRGREGFIDPC